MKKINLLLFLFRQIPLVHQNYIVMMTHILGTYDLYMTPIDDKFNGKKNLKIIILKTL